MSTSIPDTLEKILTQLIFLSQINNGQKPLMISQSIVDAKSWKGAFDRWREKESRKVLISSLKDILTQTNWALGEYYNTPYFVLLINALEKARIGINSLLTTYKEDPKMVATITVYLSNVDLQLQYNERVSVPINIPSYRSTTSSEQGSPSHSV